MLSTLVETTPSSWPLGDTEMARAVREHDWSGTPLGPISSWPASLRAAVDIMLSCGFPATLQWGRDLLLFYNDPYVPLIGARHPAALGKPILQSFPEITATYQPLLDRVWSGETVVVEDLLYRYAREGAVSDSWFTLSYSPVRDGAGEIIGVLAIGLDTTARILAERAKSEADQALRKSEQRLHRVLETEAVGVIFFDLIGRVIDANEVFLRMTGYTREDIVTGELHWRNLTPPDYVQESEGQMERFTQTGRIGPYEKEYILKDGTHRWMLFAGRELGDGTIAEYCIDVTDRKRAEQALKESERYFRALVSATSDVIYRVNADWTEMRQLRGNNFLSDTDSPDRDWLNHYIHPDDRGRVLAAIEHATATRGMFQLEHRVFRADGTIGWTLSRVVPVLDDDGNITEWFGAASDITPRKRAEMGMRESEKLAAVGRLASSIAHEINNPLEAVVNLIYLAQKTASAENLDYLNQAQSELARVGHIATETLRFNRRNARPSATDISEVIDSVLTLHEGRLRAAQITVERRNRDHEFLFLFANEIRQIVANLVGNAIDAMIDQPVRRLLVRVRGAHDPRTGIPGARLTIADTGTGMATQVLERLFEPFFTTKEITGTGLGLWVSQEIVRKHRGSMRVRSRASCGTTFSIFLPGQQADSLNF